MIVPSSGWGGEGLLGLTILFCKIEDISEQSYRVLTVAENSPAAKAGLRPDVDFVLGNTHGRFETLEDLRDKAIQNVGKEWQLMIYDSELDSVREVVLTPTPTWWPGEPPPAPPPPPPPATPTLWPGHEGGAGILGCEFACGIVHRLPFALPSSDELERRVKASLPTRSPSISVYVDPLSPNSTPGASPAPPSFFTPPRLINLNSSSLPAEVAVSTEIIEASAAAATSSVLSPLSQPDPSSPSAKQLQAPHLTTQAAVAAAPAEPSTVSSDICDAIKSMDMSAVASPGRPVLKTAVVERSPGAAVDAGEDSSVEVGEVGEANSNQTDADARVDEKQLFQQVKEAVTPKQFKSFTTNMKRLNGGSQAADVTLSNVSDMLAQRPLILQQLQLFIKQVCGVAAGCRQIQFSFVFYSFLRLVCFVQLWPSV